jgi:hypothetical protein
VSPLWRDEIGVYFSQRRLCLVRMGRGIRPKLLREEQVGVAGDSAGWEAALGALSGQLGTPEWSDARVRVVVGDQWVRYAVVPWSDSLSSGAEQMGHARELLVGIFGDVFADWRVSLSDAPPGETRLACAMPNALLEALQLAVGDHGQKLISVQPQLIAAYNSWRHRLAGDETAWFVTIEEGTMAALRTGADGINRVHSVRIGSDWTRELKRLQTFSRLASVSPTDGRVYVDVPQTLRAVLPENSGQLEWLEDEAEPPLTTLHRLEHLRRKTA